MEAGGREMTTEMIPPPAAPAFLEAAGWGDARILPLAGDASFRRYFRVLEDERQAVLMDAPPPHEDPRPFLAVADHLIEQAHEMASDVKSKAGAPTANAFVESQAGSDIVVVADPPRENVSPNPADWPADYKVPRPRKAGG